MMVDLISWKLAIIWRDYDLPTEIISQQPNCEWVHINPWRVHEGVARSPRVMSITARIFRIKAYCAPLVSSFTSCEYVKLNLLSLVAYWFPTGRFFYTLHTACVLTRRLNACFDTYQLQRSSAMHVLFFRLPRNIHWRPCRWLLFYQFTLKPTIAPNIQFFLQFRPRRRKIIRYQEAIVIFN